MENNKIINNGLTKLKYILLLIMIGFQSAKAQTWTLQQCIDTAQIHNKNLQMSKNNMAIGEQREKEAKNPYAKYDRPKYYGR